MTQRLGMMALIFRAWPIRPLAMSVLLIIAQLMVNLAIVSAAAREVGVWVTPERVFATIPSILFSFAFSFILLTALRVASDRLPKFLGLIYILSGPLFGFAIALARQLTLNDATPEYWSDPQSSIRIFSVTMVVFYVVHATFGITNLRLADQVATAEAAKKSLEVQRGRLISAQEDVRREIADFLHDRLQADLVLLGMQMQSSIEKLGEKEQAIARAYVEEIERIRQFDVRKISKQLAPELDGPSFRPVLEDLISRYREVMEIELLLTELGHTSPQMKLACYRIIEQALLNAATHAAAKVVEIKVAESDKGLAIEIRNDGTSISEPLSPGAGFATIEDWVLQYQGSWSISSNDGFTTLLANLNNQ